jgi:hypothetical protein
MRCDPKVAKPIHSTRSRIKPQREIEGEQQNIDEDAQQQLSFRQRCEPKPCRRPHNGMQGTGVSDARFWSLFPAKSRPEGDHGAVASQSLQVVKCESIIHGRYRASRYAGGLVFQLPTGGCHPVCWILPRLGSTLRFDLRMQGHVSLLHLLLKWEPCTARAHPDISQKFGLCGS